MRSILFLLLMFSFEQAAEIDPSLRLRGGPFWFHPPGWTSGIPPATHLVQQKSPQGPWRQSIRSYQRLITSGNPQKGKTDYWKIPKKKSADYDIGARCSCNGPPTWKQINDGMSAVYLIPGPLMRSADNSRLDSKNAINLKLTLIADCDSWNTLWEVVGIDSSNFEKALLQVWEKWIRSRYSDLKQTKIDFFFLNKWNTRVIRWKCLRAFDLFGSWKMLWVFVYFALFVCHPSNVIFGASWSEAVGIVRLSSPAFSLVIVTSDHNPLLTDCFPSE